MSFFGGATGFDSFLKAYRTKETKRFFLHELFISPEKLLDQLRSYDSFVSLLWNSKLVEKNYADYENVIASGLSTEQTLSKLIVKNIPPTGTENYL